MLATSAGMTINCSRLPKLNRQSVLLRQFPERYLRPRTDVLDHLGCRKRPEAARVLVTGAAHETEQKSRRKQITGAGGIDELVNRTRRNRRDAVFRRNHTALLTSSDDAERNVLAQ